MVRRQSNPAATLRKYEEALSEVCQVCWRTAHGVRRMGRGVWRTVPPFAPCRPSPPFALCRRSRRAAYFAALLPLTSARVISATCLPWYLAASSSIFEGVRFPSAPVIVEAP